MCIYDAVTLCDVKPVLMVYTHHVSRREVTVWPTYSVHVRCGGVESV